MHPNQPRYPFRTFMLHAKRWKDVRGLTDVNPKPEEKNMLLHIGNDQNQTANVMRISHMVSAEGLIGEARDFQAKRFHMVMMYIAHHMGTLKKEFIMIADGARADTPAEVFAAVHEAFLDEPIPRFGSVDVEKVISRAKEMEKTGIYDAL